MRTLQERNWIRVVGHREVPGRPELLGTTRDFLDYFGLRSLDQLPTLAELKDVETIGVQLELPGGEMPVQSEEGASQAEAETETEAAADAESSDTNGESASDSDNNADDSELLADGAGEESENDEPADETSTLVASTEDEWSERVEIREPPAQE